MKVLLRLRLGLSKNSVVIAANPTLRDVIRATVLCQLSLIRLPCVLAGEQAAALTEKGKDARIVSI